MAADDYTEIVVDGQTILLLSESGLNQAFAENRVAEHQLIGKEPPEATRGIRAKIKSDISLVKKYPVLSMALYFKDSGGEWFPTVLFQADDGLQRVFLERVGCRRCDWRGDIANPALNDLYIKVPDRIAALSRAFSQPRTPCPKCSGEVQRPVIWTEPYPSFLESDL